MASPLFAQTKLLPCELKWVSYFAGDEFPEDIVKVTDEYYIAATSRPFSGQNLGIVVGMADNTTKQARFYLEPGSPASSFQVLTNPNDCAVSWVDAPFGDIQEPE